MFKKKEEIKKEDVIKDSKLFKLKPSEQISTGGYILDTPTFGGFLNPSQIIIYLHRNPYYYNIKKGKSIFINQYTDVPPVEFVVKEIHFDENQIVLERVLKYNF